MPQYYVDIEKRLGSEFWSNRYILEATTFDNAKSAGTQLANLERTWHADSVAFTRVRVSTVDPADEQYAITTLNTFGQRNSGTALLPLFNTLRIDFNALTGRPSRKYYRGVLGEGDINGDAIVTDFTSVATDLAGNFADFDSPGIVDPQGTSLVSATVHPFVQMRQLRRSRRKRANGGGIFQ